MSWVLGLRCYSWGAHFAHVNLVDIHGEIVDEIAQPFGLESIAASANIIDCGSSDLGCWSGLGISCFLGSAFFLPVSHLVTVSAPGGCTFLARISLLGPAVFGRMSSVVAV